MARRPRIKKHVIRKIWEFPQEELEREIAHLQENYPTSHHLESRLRELKRRETNGPIPEIPNA